MHCPIHSIFLMLARQVIGRAIFKDQVPAQLSVWLIVNEQALVLETPCSNRRSSIADRQKQNCALPAFSLRGNARVDSSGEYEEIGRANAVIWACMRRYSSISIKCWIELQCDGRSYCWCAEAGKSRRPDKQYGQNPFAGSHCQGRISQRTNWSRNHRK
jgi:hypothetical protein